MKGKEAEMRPVASVESLRANIGFWPYQGLVFRIGKQTVTGRILTEEEVRLAVIDYASPYPAVISAIGLLNPLVDKLVSGELNQITIQTKSGTTQWKVATPTQPTVH